ncbi:MAG: hypothetical protein Q4E91_11040 [Lachnospiraceae bacterium]|nr:hypothetical protein [Lachnospiraceae bacterium]
MANNAHKEYLKGMKLEKADKLEEAFETYKSAADLGSTDAMWAIAKLYLFREFRKVKVNNLFELMLQGIPVFPWNIIEKEEIDYKSALEWSRKAADRGNVESALVAGMLLCEGKGCTSDIKNGISYIESAVKGKVPGAEEAYALFKPKGESGISDPEYAKKLQAFVQAAEKDDLSVSARLFGELKNGSPAQVSKLAYALMTGKNMNKPGYAAFPYLMDDNKIPVFPVSPKRVGWKTFVRIDRNAFPDGAKILFSADINVHPDFLNGLAYVGEAKYISPAFGWLREEKEADVLEFDDGKRLSTDILECVKNDYFLTEAEYRPDNIAFFVEDGEKEYSVEISALIGEHIDVLYRYTIGGSDTVIKYIEPKLLEISYLIGKTSPL